MAVPGGEVPASSRRYIDIPGVLLQRINGFHLCHLDENVPKESWQAVCEDAIQIVHLLYDRRILNRDVKTRNLIVRRGWSGYKVFMIDFALCQSCWEFEDEEQWRKAKAHEDEERAVGKVMQRYLKGKGGFVYRQSALYEKLFYDFMRG